MPTILKLTMATSSGFPYQVNFDLVRDFYADDDGGTLLNFDANHCCTVKETPDEIMAMLKET